MTRKDYAIRLEGVEALDLPFGVLRDLHDVLVIGSQRCARLMVEGRSSARGALPAWLPSVGDLRISRFAAGSLELGVTAPTLSDAAPDLFAPQALGSPLPPDATAMDLLLDAVTDASTNRTESERLDPGILEVLARAGSLFGRGATRLVITREHHEPTVLDPTSIETVRALSAATPLPRVTRVRGILDSLTVSTTAVALQLEDGRSLRGFGGTDSVETLRVLLGSDVVLEGVVTFRPSGEALRIDIESATLATPNDALWARLPKAERHSTRPRLPAQSSDLDDLFGAWPGDESDAELAAALAALS